MWKLWHKLNLRDRMITTFASVLLMMAILTIGFYGLVTRNTLLNHARNDMVAMVEQDARILREEFDRVSAETQLMAWSPLLADYLQARASNDPAATAAAQATVEELFGAFIEAIPGYDQIRFIDTTGMEQIRVNATAQGPQIIPAADLQDKSNRDYFATTMALEPGQLYISPIRLNRENGVIETPHKPVIRYAILIDGADGQPVGMVVVNVLAETFLNNIDMMADADTSVMMIGADGSYLTGTDEAQLFGADLGTGHSFATDYPADFAAIRSQATGSDISTADQPDTIMAFAQVRLQADEGAQTWYIIAQTTTQAALASLLGQVIISIIIVLSGFVLVTLLAGLVIDRITRPLKQMTHVAQRVSQGDWDVQMPHIKGHGEVAMLSTAFNTMLSDLRNTYNSLEDTVVQRTAELEQANQQLRDVDAAKSRFVAEVAHELRTPLTVMMLKLDLLSKKPEASERYIQGLEKQTVRMRSLVDGVLDLSRLDAVGQEDPTEMDMIDLNQLITAVIEHQQAYAADKGLSLEFIPDPALPVMTGNRNQVSQVVENLVSNAIKYTETGSVIVRTYHDGSTDPLVCFDVQDTGMGIPAAEIDRLWERFFRSQQVRQTAIPGTGLGLSIVKEIVELHQGKISVESQPGTGTTFHVRFPTDDQNKSA